jgi:hypothetical protein
MHQSKPQIIGVFALFCIFVGSVFLLNPNLRAGKEDQPPKNRFNNTLLYNITKEWYYYDYYMDYASELSMTCVATWIPEKEELSLKAIYYGHGTYSALITKNNTLDFINLEVLFTSLSGLWSPRYYRQDWSTLYLINYYTMSNGYMSKDGCTLILRKDQA